MYYPTYDRLELALGLLEWSGEDFWRSTPSEFVTAVNGYARYKLGKTGPHMDMTEDEMEGLLEWMRKEDGGR